MVFVGLVGWSTRVTSDSRPRRAMRLRLVAFFAIVAAAIVPLTAQGTPPQGTPPQGDAAKSARRSVSSSVAVERGVRHTSV